MSKDNKQLDWEGELEKIGKMTAREADKYLQDKIDSFNIEGIKERPAEVTYEFMKGFMKKAQESYKRGQIEENNYWIERIVDFKEDIYSKHFKLRIKELKDGK